MPYTKGHTIKHHDFSGMGPCACCGQEVSQAAVIRQASEATGLSVSMTRAVAIGVRAGSKETHAAIAKVIRKHADHSKG